eukprot:897696-Rhodomonas_salina.2
MTCTAAAQPASKVCPKQLACAGFPDVVAGDVEVFERRAALDQHVHQGRRALPPPHTASINIHHFAPHTQVRQVPGRGNRCRRRRVGSRRHTLSPDRTTRR